MENSASKPDRRVVKTKRAIHRAMIQLLAEKDLNDISVKDIAELADINRKTFYNYYTGIYRLVDEIEDDIVAYFAGLIETTDFTQALADPSIIFEKLYETIRSNSELVVALFNSKSNYSLVSKVLNTLIDMTRDAAVEHFKTDPAKTEFIIRFIFAGEIAAYQDWYHSDRTVHIKELSRTIETLCKRGLDGLLKEESLPDC